ncbi:MAG: ribosomal protein S18-alanine N-acetyltransferase [Fimbriimonadaceae bacterium]|nr:ribosomal protein S18-alanine N-acetyltransferase [Fimbriimonadaceae bacterium]
MKTLRVAPLSAEHIDRVLAIDKASQSSPWSKESFQVELDRPQGVFLVAIGDGVVVGFAGAWLVLDEAHVTNVAVDPARRRQGIARKLIRELLERVKSDGATCATLEVRAGNEPAVRLYEAFGFRSVGRRKGYYPNDGEDALVMWLDDMSDVK